MKYVLIYKEHDDQSFMEYELSFILDLYLYDS